MPPALELHVIGIYIISITSLLGQYTRHVIFITPNPVMNAINEELVMSLKPLNKDNLLNKINVPSPT